MDKDSLPQEDAHRGSDGSNNAVLDMHWRQNNRPPVNVQVGPIDACGNGEWRMGGAVALQIHKRHRNSRMRYTG